eukprot:5971370-Prymnesium_polylepis.1
MPSPSHRCGRYPHSRRMHLRTISSRPSAPGFGSASWSSPSQKPAPPRPAAPPLLLPVAPALDGGSVSTVGRPGT